MEMHDVLIWRRNALVSRSKEGREFSFPSEKSMYHLVNIVFNIEIDVTLYYLDNNSLNMQFQFL